MTTASELVASLRGQIVNTLDDLIPHGSRAMLLDYPAHGNPGDAAIWLGETRYLRERSVELVHVNDHLHTSARGLRRRLGNDGVVLLQGGGNFGSLYPEHRILREAALTTFPTNRIVLFSQTAELSVQHDVREHARAFAHHPDAFILTRDIRTQALIEPILGDRAILCPDMAFMLDMEGDRRPDSDPLLLVLREDAERQEGGSVVAPASVPHRDWLTGRTKGRPYRWSAAAAWAGTNVSARSTSRRLFDRNARAIVADGIALLSGGDYIITNRMHAHIFCVLMEKPHTLLDNSYGKNRALFETWTSTADVATWADDLVTAVAEVEGRIAMQQAT